METILIMLATGTLCIACFFIGAKVGQSVSSGKAIKVPNPINAIERHKIEKEQQKENEELSIMLENINNYDGTGLGQKDLSR